MTRYKTFVGLCILCALAFSAFVAQGASAATKGTTAFTCRKTGPGGGFTKAHCKASDAGSGEYSHVAVAEGTTTEIVGTNTATGGEKAAILLKNTQAGISYQVQAKNLEGTGWVTNAKDPVTGEHYVHGEMKVQLKELTVTEPVGKGCKIKEGTINSKQLRATTKGQEMSLKFEPAEGTVLAEYSVEGCSVSALNGAYEVTGTIACPVDGATVTCTHAATTEQGTLHERGQNSGIEGSMTLSAKDPNEGGSELTPLSATTVETP